MIVHRIANTRHLEHNSYSEHIYNVRASRGRDGDSGVGWFFQAKRNGPTSIAADGLTTATFQHFFVRWANGAARDLRGEWQWNGDIIDPFSFGIIIPSGETPGLKKQLDRREMDLVSVLVLEQAIKDFMRRVAKARK